MAYVSAKYAQQGPIPLPEGTPRSILATDDEGQEWAFREDSDVGGWQEYLANGGVVEPADPVVITVWDVNAERDRRTSAGVEYMGHVFQSDPVSRGNISDAAHSAEFAIASFVTPDEYRWQDGATEDFVWIAADNTRVPMTAYDVRELGQAMLRQKQAHIFNGRALKDMQPIPLDYADDKYWEFVPPPVE